jgi:hypothetical protein
VAADEGAVRGRLGAGAGGACGFSGPTLVSAALLVAFIGNGQDVVRAGRVELVDAEGALRAAVGADTAGVTLVMYDNQGRVSASFQLNDKPRLSIRDAGGREVARLGAVQVQHLIE